MIELKNVTYRYPFSDRNALEDISVKVRPGEAVLCTGVSGCGKSTLIRLINGLCRIISEENFKEPFVLQVKTTKNSNCMKSAAESVRCSKTLKRSFLRSV